MLLNFTPIGDGRGDLIVLEAMKNIPFEIKRVYYLTNLNSKYPRGFHAHKKLEQVLICLQGTCRIVLDDGVECREFKLTSANQGLLLDKFFWREMHDFSDDCILMVLASDYYNESDYIRDYVGFKEVLENA